MADEPRRSVRATKGQHTKIDLLDQPTEPKKKLTKKSNKKQAAQEEEEEVEVIRCVCGATATGGDDDPAPWIACEDCGVWQHNVCVNVSTYDDEIPDKYWCEECGPQFHVELLEGMKRGEKPWEARQAAYEERLAREEEEEEAAKKKGKKGKGKRTSDPKIEPAHGTNGITKPLPVPVAENKKDKKEVPARAGSTKRKTRDESHEKESAKEPSAKVRKVSLAHTTPQQSSPVTDVPSAKISDLESHRQGAASLIQKALAHSVPIAVNRGVYQYSPGDTLEAKLERLTLEIENAVYNTHPDKKAYAKQCRTLNFNLKQNQELCNSLLTKTLSPNSLAVMSTDDMASKELKRETAEMQRRSDQQAIMISDDRPRMRRTHKGDEIIEDDDIAIANDSTMSVSRRRSMLDPNADMATRSRENSPGNEVELPDNINDYRSNDDIRSKTTQKEPLNVDTNQSSATPAKQERKASAQGDFDINKVFSSVQSPTGPPSSLPQNVRRQSGNAPPANGPGFDPEIDKMLQDEDGNESPPYSPAEYDSDPEIVWRGSVSMDSSVSFPVIAKHIGGADLSTSAARIPWSDLLPKDLRVAGRIGEDKANEYLCSLRYSAPSDVVVIGITPVGEASESSFQEMFKYFHEKNRYGVLANKTIVNVRDTYLVPVEASPANLPDFITNLEGHKVPEHRESRMMLVAMAVRTKWDDQANDSTQSPSLQNHHQRQMSMTGAGPAMSPIGAPQGPFPPPNQTLASSTFAHPANSNPEDAARRAQDEQRIRDQKVGEETAARILGRFVTAPTAVFLLPNAYQMRPVEWEIIRSILETDPKAQTDLPHLSAVIALRMAADGGVAQKQTE